MGDEHAGLPSRVILMDLEYTCWADSLTTEWGDPTKPPEILGVGLVALDAEQEDALDRFHSWVRPRINPQLSEYCKGLLRVSQSEIDRAPNLAAITGQIEDWKNACSFADAVTCSWGASDRHFLKADAGRQGCQDPFRGQLHIDLMAQVRQMLDVSSERILDRDLVRTVLRLPQSTKRHDPLADALDLVGFYRWFRQTSHEFIRNPTAITVVSSRHANTSSV